MAEKKIGQRFVTALVGPQYWVPGSAVVAVLLRLILDWPEAVLFLLFVSLIKEWVIKKWLRRPYNTLQVLVNILPACVVLAIWEFIFGL